MLIKKILKLSREKISFFSRRDFIRLDKNERIENFSKKFIQNLKFTSFDLSAYPETGKIYKLLSKKLKIKLNQLLVIPGSEFGIRICLEHFCNKKKNPRLLALEPTFGMVDAYSKLYNIKKINILYDNLLQIDTNKLLKKIKRNISLVIIANPNSPTGTIIEKKSLFKIINKAKKFSIPVLIDEAYAGFYNFSYIKFIKKFQNLIVLRSFSKSYGLAGLRAGYLISNKRVMKEIYKYKPMYEINSIACKIIEKFLKNSLIEKKYIAKTNQGKKYFQNELKKMKIEYLKTYANFIHINLKNKKSFIEKRLRSKKILTRKGPGVKSFNNFLRITLGPENEMRKVIKVLKKNYS